MLSHILLLFAVIAGQTERPRWSAPEMFRHIPLGHHIYYELDLLQRCGFIRGYMNDEFAMRAGLKPFEGFWSRRELTRYEAAIAIVYQFPDTTPNGARIIRLGSVKTPLTRCVRSSLYRLFIELKPELLALGSAPQSAIQELERRDIIVPPFRDVPASHWASAAVESLHQKGILLGYPDGQFKGE